MALEHGSRADAMRKMMARDNGASYEDLMSVADRSRQLNSIALSGLRRRGDAVKRIVDDQERYYPAKAASEGRVARKTVRAAASRSSAKVGRTMGRVAAILLAANNPEGVERSELIKAGDGNAQCNTSEVWRLAKAGRLIEREVERNGKTARVYSPNPAWSPTKPSSLPKTSKVKAKPPKSKVGLGIKNGRCDAIVQLCDCNQGATREEVLVALDGDTKQNGHNVRRMTRAGRLVERTVKGELRLFLNPKWTRGKPGRKAASNAIVKYSPPKPAAVRKRKPYDPTESVTTLSRAMARAAGQSTSPVERLQAILADMDADYAAKREPIVTAIERLSGT